MKRPAESVEERHREQMAVDISRYIPFGPCPRSAYADHWPPSYQEWDVENYPCTIDARSDSHEERRAETSDTRCRYWKILRVCWRLKHTLAKNGTPYSGELKKS
jgi:hypothetical protein